jgi:hypothetical protein
LRTQRKFQIINKNFGPYQTYEEMKTSTKTFVPNLGRQNWGTEKNFFGFVFPLAENTREQKIRFGELFENSIFLPFLGVPPPRFLLGNHSM